MELKSLILGLVMSLGVFAVKSGAGMGYLLADGRRWPVQAGRALAFAAGYAAVFLLSRAILVHVDLTARISELTLLFKSGMSLHLILAVLVMAWGAALLVSRGKARRARGGLRPSKAWMALAVPCPVCFSVILLSSGFLTALYPEQAGSFVWLYLGFVGSALGAAVLFARAARGRAENLLGALMVYVSGYFMLSVLLVPQWADLGRIYRLSLSNPAGSAEAVTPQGMAPWAALLILIIFSFCLGFFRADKRGIV